MTLNASLASSDYSSLLGPLRLVISVSTDGRVVRDKSVVPTWHSQEGFELGSCLREGTGLNGLYFLDLWLYKSSSNDKVKIHRLSLPNGTLCWIHLILKMLNLGVQCVLPSYCCKQ